MIIPQIDQDLAIVKSIEVQYRNGYTITTNDARDFKEAVRRINALYRNIIVEDTEGEKI